LGSSAIIFQGVTDPPSLEALACREALSLATDLSTQRVCVASDCKQVVNDIAVDSGDFYAPSIKEILVDRLEFEKSTFIHEGRKSNSEAHSLAQHALSLGPWRHMWILEPHDILLIFVVLAFDQ
jgi:ribonuclease HI